MHAEAHGFAQAVQSVLDLHAQWRAANPVDRLRVVFQLDNLPLVQYLNRVAKCTHRCAASLVDKALISIALHTSDSIVEYIPREANVFADQGAGLASQELLQLEGNDTPNDPLTTFLPLPFLTGGDTPRCTFTTSANSFTLLETPAVTRLLFLAFLRATNLSTHSKKLVWQYYRTFFLPTPTVHALQVRYQRTRGERFYAKAPAAQQLPS
jgi:hypothetical protein